MFQSYYGPTGIFSELEVILITSAVDLGYITVFDCKRDASGFYLCFFLSYQEIFSHTESSLLLLKSCKFRPILGAHGHWWAVIVL